MIRKYHYFLFFLFLMIFLGCQSDNDPFTFVVTADMRYMAKEEYRNSSYFQGACEAIKKYGKGVFMISPGDIDPPAAVREVISNVLGKDYPWYPVVGNHELDDSLNMVFLRNYNKDGNSLPNIVRSGPEGCVETTYSFDYGDNHFVVLNQYYDGTSDAGTDGVHVPELLDWLQKDLADTRKTNIFVFGHEPLIAIPDIDNGRLRHADDSLNKYPHNSFKFYQLLKKYHVAAYICGHTHNASIAKINDIWQIDVGHARGVESYFPDHLIMEIMQKIEQENKMGTKKKEVITEYYKQNNYEALKVLYYSDLTNGVSYKEIDEKTGLNLLLKFVNDYIKDPEKWNQYKNSFWRNANLARSTFVRIISSANDIKVEFYRDDARGGDYDLKYTFSLN